MDLGSIITTDLPIILIIVSLNPASTKIFKHKEITNSNVILFTINEFCIYTTKAIRIDLIFEHSQTSKLNLSTAIVY